MNDLVIIFAVIAGLLIVALIFAAVIGSRVKNRKKKKAEKAAAQKIKEKRKKSSEKTTAFEEPSSYTIPTVNEWENYGEKQIYECLKDYELQGCKFLFNLYIPKNNGETTEIDVLMISSKGIFVLESKNLSGYVKGDGKERYWTQIKTDEWGESITERFYNPIRQNEIHVISLQQITSFEYPIYSIVVFSDKCKLEYDSSSIDCETRVVTINDLKDAVAVVFKYMQSDMTDDDIETVYDLLYPYTQVSGETKMRHVQNIKHNHFSEKISSDIFIH